LAACIIFVPEVDADSDVAVTPDRNMDADVVVSLGQGFAVPQARGLCVPRIEGRGGLEFHTRSMRQPAPERGPAIEAALGMPALAVHWV